MRRLEGKVAVCTGSGRAGGLGEAILMRLAQSGCDVVVTDLGNPQTGLDETNIGTTDGMQDVVRRIEALGARAVAIPCDVRDADQVQALVDKTVDAFGRLDILVNNAGVGYVMKTFSEVTADDWRLVIDVNLTGAFLCTQAAAAQMKRQGDGGRVVNIASQAAKSGFPHMAPYVASKHGMIGLTRSAAIDFGADGITVNAVCPNHVTTELGKKQNEYFAKFRGQSVEEYRTGIRSRIPLGRVGLPEDTAAATEFLASDDASFITGEAINVSGGEEMH